MKRFILIVVATIGIVQLFGCRAEQQQIDGKTMGTYYSIKYVTNSSVPNRATLQAAIDAELEEVNRLMSTYRADSEISLFNRSQAVNTPFPISPPTAIVINEALRIAALTDNGLDVTIGPLVNLWGFGPQAGTENLPPAQELITERLNWIGLDKLKIEDRHLIKTVPQLSIDLSAIAKGYGVDIVADYLESQGISNYLVDIGGEVRATGRNQQGKIWRVAIEQPVAGIEQQVQRIIELNDMAIATSGSYRNYYDVAGVRYSHTIDPKTGYPIQNDIVSITVIAPNAMSADGFATGLGVVGPDRAIEIAESLNLAIFMLIRTETGFIERYSSVFSEYMK